jgi:hypothetical protein
MSQREEDEEREERIDMEIVVDAYGPEERAMGWCCYLMDTVTFPFTAKCRVRRSTSPLRVGAEVEVMAMAPEEECEHDMLVMIRWEEEGLAVPLSQLEVVHGDAETQQAVADWQYWVERGYEF